jgi:hypothetical protein
VSMRASVVSPPCPEQPTGNHIDLAVSKIF